MESRETELCSKLYKTGKEQQIFLGFRILKQEQKETSNKAKSFWIFRIPNRNWKVKQTNTRKLKKQRKRNNRNIFGIFVFWEVETKQEQQRKIKKVKHGYTKSRQNIMYR
jgi:hypothetical protein